MKTLDQIEEIPSRTELLERWESLMGKPPPARLSNVRLYRGIRYTEQIAADPALQRLDRQVNRRLMQLARQKKPKSQSILPGTRLLREWHGRTYDVLVTDKGYIYEGTTYRSLTAIATLITGSQRSGPQFFGLK